MNGSHCDEMDLATAVGVYDPADNEVDEPVDLGDMAACVGAIAAALVLFLVIIPIYGLP